MQFQKAQKTKSKLRMAITGASGSGKTFTALSVAKGIGEKIALIETEYGSASKYADLFDFDALDISSNTHPNTFIMAIREAVKAGYDVLIIDSLTHAWDATKKEVDKVAKASKSGNSFNAWSEGTKIWDALKAEINASQIHTISTMRSKTEYIIETNERGKQAPRKIGMAPEVRDGTEYEYDVVLDMDFNHFGVISKTRCHILDGYAQEKPSAEMGETLKAWLTDGIEPPKREPIKTATNAPQAPKVPAPVETDEQKKARFVRAMGELCAKMGEEAYFNSLAELRFESADDVPANSRQAVYESMTKAYEQIKRAHP